MALIICPECNLQVSDLAYACPHCGLPMKGIEKPKHDKKVKRSRKKLRLPNGFGQITEIKNQRLRNPFRAMLTTGKTSEGKPICKIFGYYATYNDAYYALVEYNRNPYDLDSDITMNELFEEWKPLYQERVKENSNSALAAWLYCSKVYNIRVKDIRPRHIRDCIENGTHEYRGEIRSTTPNTKSRIKTLFNLMLDYAVEREIVEQNYSRMFNIDARTCKEANDVKKEHISFTDDEMKTLWDNVDTIGIVDAILIQCYSGWRPQELCLLEIENIDLEKWTFVGGMKTEAGKMRTVPIHPKIRELVQKRVEKATEIGSNFLFNCESTSYKSVYGIQMTYDKYAYRYSGVIKKLNLNPEHRPHDPRKQFITMGKRYEMDEYAIKYIVGHEIIDITERVYTDRDLGWLETEIAKIQ